MVRSRSAGRIEYFTLNPRSRDREMRESFSCYSLIKLRVCQPARACVGIASPLTFGAETVITEQV